MIAETTFRLFLRGMEDFAPLAAQADYTVAKSNSAAVSEQVLLRPLSKLRSISTCADLVRLLCAGSPPTDGLELPSQCGKHPVTNCGNARHDLA